MTINAHSDMLQVINEFGPYGPQPAAKNLRAYRKGGSYVGTSPGTANVGTCASALKLSSFNGAFNVASSTFSNLITATGPGSIAIVGNSKGVTVEVWGGGGGGAGGEGVCQPAGGGGGGGAYSRTTVNWPTPYSGAWGSTINYSVGAGGPGGLCNVQASPGGSSNVSSAYFPTMTATGGTGGWGAATGPSQCGGFGGSASGGNVTNVGGNVGLCGVCSNAGAGGAAIVGLCSAAYGKGGNGGILHVCGPAGSPGAVKFSWF